MTRQEQWGRALIGARLGRYEVSECLGNGSFGVVCEAVEVDSGLHVAIKIVPSAQSAAALEFANEGNLLKKLNGSSNVVHLHESGEAEVSLSMGGAAFPVLLPYHVLELAQGCLEELVLHRESLDWTERLLLWRGIVRGVHQMHLKNVAHRDLKSSNCLLLERPKNLLEAKVADLGRSRDLGGPPLHEPVMYLQGLGDLRFAPPEFILCQGSDSKESHLRADLYGLGSLLFELATGQGVTAMALSPGPELVRQSLVLHQEGVMIDLAAMSVEFEPIYQLFERSVPRSIATPAGALLRQLCSPEPVRRQPIPKFGTRAIGSGLDWLLRRADILICALRASDSGARGNVRKSRRSA